MRLNNLVAAVGLLLISTGVLGYKEYTHALVSQSALQRSMANDPALLKGLGLGNSVSDAYYTLPFQVGAFPVPFRYTPSVLVFQGSMDEDTGTRSFNHFMDPQQEDIPLTIFGAKLGIASPDWALEIGGEVDGQNHSYRDAKEYLYSALVGAAAPQRDKDLGSVFYTLGHVIHHLQDMAQPQHVRNDDHCDKTSCKVALRFKPSGYEEFTFDRGRNVPLDGYPGADYSTFSTPHAFWRDAGRGVAEFTSHNFVSAGRNFRRDGGIAADPEHPNPNATQAFISRRQITDPDLLGPQGPDQPLAGEIWFVGTPVTDQYRPSPSLNGRTSTYSIFDADLVEMQGEGAFTLNRFNYAAANEFLLPRAAAYSTGLINYFFRGRIEIGLPEQGVYGVIDHATTYAAGQGFGKLKLKLRNASPDGVKPSGERVPQTMQGGTLVAVAKYTLNSCYQPDLSGDYAARFDTGEIIPPSCSLQQYLAGDEQIAQSAAILAASLDTATPTEFTFDFSSQPIPVNARDLRVQVVYTGTLGAEDDAIAFGGRDISEPTHIVVYNNTDYFAVDGKLYTPEQIRSTPALAQRVAGINIDPKPMMSVALSAVSGKPIVGPSGTVAVNGYIRVAVLAEKSQPLTVNVLSRLEGAGFSQSSFTGVPTAVIDLRNPDGYITAFGIFRGPRGHFFDAVFKANSSAPVSGEELTVMSTRTGADPGPTQIPVTY